MTDRLYYTDPYLRDFDATVGRLERRDGRAHVTLDRTAFYPTSGGQPYDLGTLGGYPVVDVIDEDTGEITHVVDETGAAQGRTDPSFAPLGPGAAVHGVIDWVRRFDHMQQHTGQHVLSAAFQRMFGARTVSFHLGADVSTIDLARELPSRDLGAAEAEANRVVWEDRPVSIRFADSEEAAQLSLRKEPKRTGRLRLIEVEDFDLSACGGTHVARTGGIGVIALGGWERFKGGQRIEFLCGGRALRRFGSLRDAAAEATKLLSVGPVELAAAIERLLGEARDQKRTAAALQNELARYRAGELATSADTIAGARVVLRAVDADAGGLKALASAITERAGHVAVLVSTGAPLVVVARSSDLTVPANAVLAALTARFGGRGGGRPELAQGGGFNATPQQVLDAAREAIATETR